MLKEEVLMQLCRGGFFCLLTMLAWEDYRRQSIPVWGVGCAYAFVLPLTFITQDIRFFCGAFLVTGVLYKVTFRVLRAPMGMGDFLILPLCLTTQPLEQWPTFLILSGILLRGLGWIRPRKFLPLLPPFWGAWAVCSLIELMQRL